MNEISQVWMPVDNDERELVRVRRRQGRSAEKRARILKAAAREFADQGFDGASTRSIARNADVRHALVIYHFKTKQNLWQAVMQDIVQRFQDAYSQRLDSSECTDPVIKLQVLQAEFIRVSAQQPELHWLMSHEAGRGGERLDWLMDHLLSNSFDLFRSLVIKTQATGHYVQGDPNHLHYLFLGAAARIFMLSSEVEKVTGQSPFAPEFVENHIALCRELFFRTPPSRRRRRRALPSQIKLE